MQQKLNVMKQSHSYQSGITRSIKMLSIVSLLLLLSACSSKQVVQCEPIKPEAWMMQPMPLELNLRDPLYKALTE